MRALAAVVFRKASKSLLGLEGPTSVLTRRWFRRPMPMNVSTSGGCCPAAAFVSASLAMSSKAFAPPWPGRLRRLSSIPSRRQPVLRTPLFSVGD